MKPPFLFHGNIAILSSSGGNAMSYVIEEQVFLLLCNFQQKNLLFVEEILALSP